MKYIRILIYALLLWGGALQAQDRISSYHEEKTEKWTVKIFGNDPLAVREYTLNNGMKVITSVNHSEPRIYTMVAVKTGSKNDPADHTGLAHYLEHMLFKGTDKYGTQDWSKEKVYLDQIDMLYEKYNQTVDENLRKAIYRQIDSVSQIAAKYSIANEYDKMCQAMGASGTNAFTSNEQTVYINDIPSNMLHKWLELEAERYRNPVLRLFHTELEAVYEEKNMGMDNDDRKVWEKLYAGLFEKHNYGLQTTIGTVEHLKNPSLLAIRDYYQKYYVPNNMAIILSGDFDPDAAADGVAEHFKYMQPKEVPAYHFDYEMIHAQPRKLEIYGPDAGYVTIGYRMPGAGSREVLVAKLISYILQNSTAGLIDLNLIKKQRVLSANVYLDVLNDYSVFVLTGKPREGQTLEEVRDLLTEQLTAIMNGKYDDQLIKSILLNEDISRISGFKSNETRCSFLMEAFVNGQGYQKLYNELWEMGKITREQISDVVRDYLSMDRVEVYKRQGKDTTIKKIEKPEIHGVELNRDKTSEFVSEWLKEETETIKPVFADFDHKIQKANLSGVPLYYVKNTENRLFTMVYRFDYGKFHNKAMPLAMQYLSLVGVENMSAEDISKKMYELGCKFYAQSGDKYSYLTLFGPEESFDQALEIFENLITHPKADENAFKSLVENEKKKRADAKMNNKVIASRLSQYALYGAQNPATWVLNTQELDQLKAENLIKIITGLNAEKHIIEYYGKRESVALQESLEKQHKTAKNLTPPVPVEFLPRSPKENEVFFVNYDMVQASVYWTSGDINYNYRDASVIMAFNQYFGGDMSSVVFQNIRESKALAYSTYAFYNSARYAGKPNSVIAFVGTQADKFKDALASMNDLLTHLPADSGVFALSMQSLYNQIETKRIQDEDLVGYYFEMQDLGCPGDLSEVIYNDLGKMNMDKVSEFHKNHVSGKTFAYAILASKDKIPVSELKNYGKLTELSLDQIFGY